MWQIFRLRAMNKQGCRDEEGGLKLFLKRVKCLFFVQCSLSPTSPLTESRLERSLPWRGVSSRSPALPV
ncbi:hypothetical protein K1719_011012 [Acacia pycnantha]|nr:hypothetical protein K1719_011012 [Acacia pycnantha]